MHFLKVLRSWAINKVKRKKLTEDYNRFSSIVRTSVILSSVLKIGQMLKTYEIMKQEGQVALKRSPEFCLKLTYRYL